MKNNAGRMTKMAGMSIYGKKTLKIFFPGTSGTISRKLGMYENQGLRPLIVCSNYDPGLTLISLARSKMSY